MLFTQANKWNLLGPKRIYKALENPLSPCLEQPRYDELRKIINERFLQKEIKGRLIQNSPLKDAILAPSSSTNLLSIEPTGISPHTENFLQLFCDINPGFKLQVYMKNAHNEIKLENAFKSKTKLPQNQEQHNLRN